jgi:hypothetical protein
VRHAPVVRRILLRAALFLVPGSALRALLPLIAIRRLGLGAGGYGGLLGALGSAPSAARSSCRRSGRVCRPNALVAVASLSCAAALAVVVLSRSIALTVLVLLPAGVAWIAFLSNVNAALQVFLLRWVRARGLSVYQMVLFGGQAAGAVIWGVVAGAAGLVPAFLISAAVMAAGAATLWFWPFHQIADMDRSPVRWPEPQLLISADRGNGLVLVRTTYTIAAALDRTRVVCRCASGLALSPRWQPVQGSFGRSSTLAWTGTTFPSWRRGASSRSRSRRWRRSPLWPRSWPGAGRSCRRGCSSSCSATAPPGGAVPPAPAPVRGHLAVAPVRRDRRGARNAIYFGGYQHVQPAAVPAGRAATLFAAMTGVSHRLGTSPGGTPST